MVLQDNTLFYYPKPGAKAKGQLVLESDDSAHNVDNSEKSPFMFAINTCKRSYLMYPDTMEERSKWVTAINDAVDAIRVSMGAAPRKKGSMTLRGSRSNSADGEDASPQTIVPDKAEEARLREKLVALAKSSNVGLTRQVLIASVSSVSWVSASEMLSRSVHLLASRAPREADAPEGLEPASWTVRRCEEDLHLVGLSVASSAELMMQRVVDFL